MKKISLLLFASSFLLTIGTGQPNSTPGRTTATMKLLSPYFSFNTKASPQGLLNKDKSRDDFSSDEKVKEGFTIKVKINFKEFVREQTVLEVPGIVSIKFRQADPAVRERQNYPAFVMSDGAVPVLEASIMLTAPVEKDFKREMTIGFPLAELKNPWREHEVILNFTSVQWTMYVDGEIMDNDFAIGYPHFGGRNSWQINPDFVNQASLFFPAIKAERDNAKKSDLNPDVQYWTPRWHNAWVGDVATIFHNGRYHVFYLFDRRHHASKFGVGGHYFEHLSTTDFITWTEHEAATPIEQQWETFGTGVPFVYNNKLHLSYGLHTSRIYPDSLTMYPAILDYYNQHQRTGYFLGDIKRAVPSGSTYSVSDDGISRFKKSDVLFHYSENPSMFVSPDGKLKMFANYKSKGTWESSALDSGWYCTDPAFPLGGDCTFYFTWGKFEYVVGGFVNLWKRPIASKNQPWDDEVAAGKDFYNGVSVPSVSGIGNGRYLMAGWIPINGWGGPLVVHELIQYPDGRIGTKWMRELIPATRDTATLAQKIKKESSFPVKDDSFILSFDVHPKKNKDGWLAVSFLSSGQNPYEKACELQINTGAMTAQYSTATKDSFTAPERSLRQGGAPHHVGNYAIENLSGVDKPFSVRILVKSNAKLGGAILDTEIAGKNTLISYRSGLKIENISFKENEVSIRNVSIMKIDE